MTEATPEPKNEQPIASATAEDATPAEIKRLLDQRKAINAAIRAEKSKNKVKARTLRNRRGILTGLAALEWMEVFPNPALAEQLQRARDWWLTKPDERALFGLPPRLEIVTPRRKAKAKAQPEATPENQADASGDGVKNRGNENG